jgi:membrane-associated phospholipid phosphatase
MLLLGIVVRRGSTPLDDWFQSYRHSPGRWLLFLLDPRALGAVLVVCVVVALSRRRWWLAAATVLGPIAAVALVKVFKPLLGREKQGGLAYPSGHTTVAVVVLGVAVLAAGLAWWAVLIAIAWCALGMVGVGITYHYFTDTVGGLLLGTAIVCVAALVLRRAPHPT